MRNGFRNAWIVALLIAGFAPRFSSAETIIRVINIDGTGLRTVAAMPGYTFHGSPSWSHDGKRIAFDASPGGTPNGRVFVVDLAGGEPRDLGVGAQPNWSADDKQLCYFVLSGMPGGETPGVWVMNSEGQAKQFLTQGLYARWSNDGGKIAYMNRSPTGQNIFVYSILDAESKPLLNERFARLSPPAWSEDGKQICFIVRREANSDPEMCLVETEGDNKVAVKLKDGVSFVTPSWAPGKNIVFGMGGLRNAQPHWLDPSKDEPTKIECTLVNFWDPCWSPDGKQIAFRCDK